MLTKEEELALKTQIHPSAALLVRRHVREFTTVLILQAKILAYKKGDGVVVNSHVENALKIIRKNQDRDNVKVALNTFGGVFLGVAVPGFISELSAGRSIYVVLYTILGIIGLTMVFVGLQR